MTLALHSPFPPNPSGVITGATNVVTTVGTAAFVVADLYATQNASGARFSPKATWMSSNTIANSIYRLAGGGSVEPQPFNDDRSVLLGKAWNENSNVVATVTTGSLFLLVELVAGQSFVHRKDHYLIRQYPHLWAPDGEARKLRPARRRSRAWAL